METRLAILETEFRYMRSTYDAHVEEQRDKYSLIDSKLDNLLQFRDKGMGAFWLASTIVGTGIVSGIVMLFNWIKHG